MQFRPSTLLVHAAFFMLLGCGSRSPASTQATPNSVLIQALQALESAGSDSPRKQFVDQFMSPVDEAKLDEQDPEWRNKPWGDQYEPLLATLRHAQREVPRYSAGRSVASFRLSSNSGGEFTLTLRKVADSWRIVD